MVYRVGLCQNLWGVGGEVRVIGVIGYGIQDEFVGWLEVWEGRKERISFIGLGF